VEVAQGEPAYGRTNWRRFALAVGVPAVATAGLLIGMSNGAFAASLTVSGQYFKLSADSLEGDNFVQYGGGQAKVNGEIIPMAMSGMEKATLVNMCQSVRVPKAPVSLIIRAGREKGEPVEAKNLLIGMTELSGETTFSDIDIGVDAGTLARNNKGGSKVDGAAGTFAQQAAHVSITGLRQIAYSTQAGSFTLNGLSLKISVATDSKGPDECY
jgi:Family of unknown function (DUF6230)